MSKVRLKLEAVESVMVTKTHIAQLSLFMRLIMSTGMMYEYCLAIQ